MLLAVLTTCTRDDQTTASVKGAAKMIALEVRLARTEYLTEEEIEFRVRIQNGTDAVIRLPDPALAAAVQPVFTLTGPSFPDGHVFSQSTLNEMETGPDKQIEIAAGAHHEYTVSLRLLGALSPGEYRLDSTLELGDARAESATRTLRIRSLTIASIDLGFGTGHPQGLGAFLDRRPAGTELFTFAWQEDSPEIDEASIDAPMHRLTLRPDATDVRTPRPNAGFFAELLQWVVWREGRAVRGLHTAALEPISVDLPGDAAFLVHPALEPKAGTIEVLALLDDGRELHLVRFAGGVGAESAQLAGKTTLPARPTAITTALSPREGGSARHIVAVVQHDDEVEVLRSSWGDDGKFGPFASVRAKGRMIGNVAPAVRVGADAGVRVGVLAISGGKNDCVVIEADFPASGQPSGPRMDDIGELPDTAIGGALHYVGDRQRTALVLLDENRLLKADTGQKLTPVVLAGTPTAPILLVQGEQRTYLLYSDSTGSLALQPLY